MAGDTFNILYRYLADGSQFQRETGKAAGAADGLTTSAGKTKGALSKIPPVAKAAAAGAALMAAKWAVDGIAMAATAEQVADSFDKTFGDASEAMRADLDATRQALGLSQGELERMALTMGQTAKATGQSEEEAAAFASQMIVMAGDVAAFNGDLGSSEEVLGAFQAAIRGEFDPMERFGIAIKQADVNQKALAMTGKEATAELTAQEKQAATLALIQSQLADETGSLADATEDGSTKQNEMNARLKDAQTRVGGALTPLKTMVLELVIGLLPVLEALLPVLDVFGVLLETVMVLLKPLIDLVAWLVRGIADMVDWLIRGTGFLDRLTSGLNSLRVALKNAFAINTPSWWGKVGAMFGGGSYHSGGVVPGPTGSLQPALLQGGERVIPAGSNMAPGGHGSGGGGMVVNVTINAGVGDPVAIGRELETVLGEYGRQKGGLDLPLTGV